MKPLVKTPRTITRDKCRTVQRTTVRLGSAVNQLGERIKKALPQIVAKQGFMTAP
jgi:hypothetical protein